MNTNVLCSCCNNKYWCMHLILFMLLLLEHYSCMTESISIPQLFMITLPGVTQKRTGFSGLVPLKVSSSWRLRSSVPHHCRLWLAHVTVLCVVPWSWRKKLSFQCIQDIRRNSNKTHLTWHPEFCKASLWQ